MSYPRENTIQQGITGSANTAVTLKLPNGATGSPVGNPVGASQRYRVKFLSVNFGGAAAPSIPALLTVTDGAFTYVFAVTGPLVLTNIDWQCAPGAEVDFTLAAGGASLVGHINVSATVEG